MSPTVIVIVGIAAFLSGFTRLWSVVWYTPARGSSFVDALLLVACAFGAAYCGLPAIVWLTASGLAVAVTSQVVWRSVRFVHLTAIIVAASSHLGVQAASLAGLSLGATLWTAYELDKETSAGVALENGPELFKPIRTEEIPCLTAYTDQNRPVAVLSPREPLAALQEVTPDRLEKSIGQWFDPPRILQLEDATPFANCHGWTFTGGRYLVRGTDVPQILRDNGYKPVPKAQLGDVVIYHSSEGNQILHSGIVHSVASDGGVFIESKWGFAGLYLHELHDQPYGNRVTFYRSPRPGHLLRNLDKDESISAN